MPEGHEIQQVAQIADYILSLIRDDSGNRWLIFSKGPWVLSVTSQAL